MEFKSEVILDGITRITCPGNVYAFLAEGSDSGVLIDTGFGIGSLKDYVDSIAKVPYTVILTHGHLDHAGGAAEFDEVYMNPADLTLAEKHTSTEFRSNRLGFDESEAKEKLIPPRPVSGYKPLMSGQAFDLGGLTITVYDLQGHTPGSMCVLFNESRTMLLGDACNSLGYMFLPESLSIATYADALSEFLKLEGLFDNVLYSHPHNFGGKEILRETIELCNELLSGERKGILRGTSPYGGDIYIAKPVDEKEHPMDGSTANFIFRKDNVNTLVIVD